MGFKPWGWVIGSGIYVDNVLAEAKALWWKLGLVVAGVLLLGLYAFRSFYVAMRGGLQDAADAADAVRAGDLDFAIPPRAAHNEEGRLVASLRVMQDSLRARQQQDREQLEATRRQADEAAEAAQ
jgi:methyl-accepting chemotaxis protein